MAQRNAMDVLSTNIAHANDPTYKRQRLVMSENLPLAAAQDSTGLGPSLTGSGVRSTEIVRVRDALIENRLRTATSAGSQWEYMNGVLQEIQAHLSEPSDTGLGAELNQFWNEWQNVANSPDSDAARSQLLEQASALCARIRYTYQQMSNIRGDLSLAVTDRVDRINNIAEEIASLNEEVGRAEEGTSAVNALLDRRDALVVELSQITEISQHGEGASDFILSIGSHVLVQGNQYTEVYAQDDGTGTQRIYWQGEGDEAVIEGGELRAILDLNSDIVPSYLGQLDAIATSLVTEVNALHATGTTLTGVPGEDFFDATSTAANIDLDAAMIGHPELIAASLTGAVSNNDVALDIADVREKVLAASGLTINGMYQALVGDIASATAVTEREATAHTLSMQQLQAQQQQVSGVSLDEELTNMIKFQQAYNAAARVLTVMDEMLGQLIERTGLGGR